MKKLLLFLLCTVTVSSQAMFANRLLPRVSRGVRSLSSLRKNRNLPVVINRSEQIDMEIFSETIALIVARNKIEKNLIDDLTKTKKCCQDTQKITEKIEGLNKQVKYGSLFFIAYAILGMTGY